MQKTSLECDEVSLGEKNGKQPHKRCQLKHTFLLVGADAFTAGLKKDSKLGEKKESK